VGKEVVAGIRPEDVHDPAYLPSGIRSTAIEANADLVEHLGSEAYVYLQVNGEQIVGRFDPRTAVETGQPVKAALNLDKLHVFSKADSAAL
jgi:multiple sugar transport system ATP-binding protein